MRKPSLSSAAAALLLAAIIGPANAAIIVIAERDFGLDQETTGEFHFEDVPSNVAGDLLEGAGASISASFAPGTTSFQSSGSIAQNVARLRNGTVQTVSNDSSSQTVFFRDTAITSGRNEARFHFDLGAVFPVGQFNSYSWHDLGASAQLTSRAPQWYDLYAADGTAPGFDSTPDVGVDPTTVGWSLVGSVNTRSLGENGQHGVSFSSTTGVLGDYRYFTMATFSSPSTTSFANFFHTFYGEVDIVEGTLIPEPTSLALLAIGGLLIALRIR